MNLQQVTSRPSGRRKGEHHHKAKLTNHEVELMRRLHEEHPVGHPDHMGCRKLAKMFEVSVRQVWRVCTYRNR